MSKQSDLEATVNLLQKLDRSLLSAKWLTSLRRHLEEIYIFQEKYHQLVERAQARINQTRPSMPG